MKVRDNGKVLRVRQKQRTVCFCRGEKLLLRFRGTCACVRLLNTVNELAKRKLVSRSVIDPGTGLIIA